MNLDNIKTKGVIDENKFVDLNQGDFIIVPKGTLHRPVCKDKVKVLLIEKAGTLTKDNTGGTYSG